MKYHIEYLHGLAIASTQYQTDVLVSGGVYWYRKDNVVGGAMWARMPITSLIADEVLDEMPERMDTPRQPWIVLKSPAQ